MSASQQLSWSDDVLTLAGAVSVQREGAFARPWRVFHDRLDLYEPALLVRAAHAAGVRLTLVSDTSTLAVEVEGVEPIEPSVEYTFDLLVDGRRHDRQSVVLADTQQATLAFTNLPAGSHRLELYLPQFGAVRLGRVSIDADASATRWDDPRPKWVVYGSSITQCREAAGPSETWPALVANRFGLNLTCLGFGGQCHIDPMMGRTIGELPADTISLCLGINTHNGTFSERTFRAAVIGLIQLIRDRHADVPMVCVSPIYSPPREDKGGNTGMTLKQMREWIADAVQTLQRHGDTHLACVDGLELFGPDYLQYMPDNLHPNAEGYRQLADRYAEVVMPKLGLTAHATTGA